ncbi:alpha-amylase family glycosyl hydrolase [Psychroserpens luteolus]|uniref:alpha-amylase family glycosyl hydrolase n=1 Tax=Psychroserpens luteolus TaxID=2855840 RepID=UPI001E42B039|nr:alpha-amylase family glycosyl hydrolase [Psychroserpens luteolus]MCD2257823.1 T9SS type A sorting domain-containing protein [Psychroserpens luteolus]
MKRKLYVLLLLCSSFLSAQVSLDVGAIEVDQPVTITVDINSTDSDCNGLNSPAKVYMHSGIGDNSNAFGFSVIGNWGQDDGVGEMTDNGDGTYSITITPQSYYGLNQTQADNATQIGMVFRNPDGTQELKANGCNDFIFPIGSVSITITQPSSSVVILNSGDDLAVSATIQFQGATTVQGSFDIFKNDEVTPVVSGTCGFPSCNTTIQNITESAIYKFVGSPQSSTETGEAFIEVYVISTVIEEAMPAGVEDGINYDADQTKATLVLTAPKKEFVQIAGSFNNYLPTSADVMKRDPSTGKYWLELTGLTPGQIETYQYWVFDTNPVADSPALVKTADPYSTLVLSPFDDPFIPASSYPNLPVYPDGQEREVTVLQTGQTPYNWQVTNFEKPKEEDLIVYEVLVRDFDSNRNYQDLIDRIDYFKNLNINAIQLMPVMEFEGNESWGYNTSFHMALDKYYGTEDKFKEFIDLCHQNGIAVILDLAINHAFGRSPMVRMWMDDPDNDGWGGPSSENPYFNQTPQHSYNVGSDFSHTEEEPNDPGASTNQTTNPITNDYVERVLKHWIVDFKIDGIRWDLTKGFTQNCENNEGCTNSYQQDRVDILKAYADYSWSLDPDHYVIFEHLGQENEEKEWANYRFGEGKGIMMWGKMTDPYNQLTMGFSSNTNISGIGHKSRSQFDGPRVMGYPESHDEERLMYKNIEFGNNSNGSHNVRDLNTALSRMSALGAVSLTVPGPKMIWHFAALGMDNSIFTCPDGSVNNPNCKLDTKPQPQWTENWLSDPNRNQIYNDWARLNALKINEPVFEGDYTITSGNLTPRIDIFDTSLPTTELRNVIVLANFDVVAQTVNTSFPTGGNWFDLMDDSGSTTYSASTVTIEPGQFRIFGNVPVTLSTEDFDTNNTFSIYPNPVNTSFKTNKTLNRLQIFDITGKLVKSFKGDFTENDTYDISDLTQSIYLVKIENDNGQTLTSKLIKL